MSGNFCFFADQMHHPHLHLTTRPFVMHFATHHNLMYFKQACSQGISPTEETSWCYCKLGCNDSSCSVRWSHDKARRVCGEAAEVHVTAQ